MCARARARLCVYVFFSPCLWPCFLRCSSSSLICRQTHLLLILLPSPTEKEGTEGGRREKEEEEGGGMPMVSAGRRLERKVQCVFRFH